MESAKLGDPARGRLLLIPFAPGIGDTVMMEPLLQGIVASLPDWQVTLVGKEYVSDLLPPGGYDLVSPPYFVSEPPAVLRPIHRLVPQKLIAWAAEPAISLDLGHFDRAINLFWAWESRTPFDRWWTPQWPLQAGVRHAVDLLAEYLAEEEGIEVPKATRGPRIRPFPEAIQWAEGFVRLLPGSGPLAALVVSSTDALKWWDARKWAAVNDHLAGEGWQTLLLAPRDHPHAQKVYAGCERKPAWPEVDLRQLVALLDRSSVVVGVDTGPLHIASALGTAWVGLFGATNPDLIGPYDRSRGRPLLARFPKPPSCNQCWLAFKNRDDRCLTLPATGCTTMVPVRDVLDAVFEVASGTPFASKSLPALTGGRDSSL